MRRHVPAGPAFHDHLLRTIDTNYVQMFDNLYFNFHYCRRLFFTQGERDRRVQSMQKSATAALSIADSTRARLYREIKRLPFFINRAPFGTFQTRMIAPAHTDLTDNFHSDATTLPPRFHTRHSFFFLKKKVKYITELK